MVSCGLDCVVVGVGVGLGRLDRRHVSRALALHVVDLTLKKAAESGEEKLLVR
jgi:hypothetical protein